MIDPTANATRDLARAQSLLTAITGRILQVSDRKAGVVMGVATKAVMGSAFATSVTGAVGALGTASTGTAIAGLAGVAKSNAVFYWIGSLVGGGVAAGGVILGAGAIGAGVYGSIRVRRVILGHARRREGLSEPEQAILQAADALIAATRETLETERAIGEQELALFSRVGIAPLLSRINAALAEGLFDDLKAYNRARLRGHVLNLRSLQRRLDPS